MHNSAANMAFFGGCPVAIAAAQYFKSWVLVKETVVLGFLRKEAVSSRIHVLDGHEHKVRDAQIIIGPYFG